MPVPPARIDGTDAGMFGRFFALSPDCAFALDDAGAIVEANDRAIRAFPVDSNGSVEFADLFVAEDRVVVYAAVQAVMAGASRLFAARRLDADGAPVVWETSCSPWPTTDGVARVLCLTRTSLIAPAPVPPGGGQEADHHWVRASTSALAMDDAAPAMVWRLAADGAVLSANRLATAAFEGARAQADWLLAVRPEDRAPTARLWDEARRTGVALAADVRFATGDHAASGDQAHAGDRAFRWHAVRLAPSPDGSWVAIATDIHDLKRSAEGLAADNEQLEQDIFRQLHEVQQTQSRLQAYFDACPDYLSLLRLSNETGITYEDVNPAAEALYELDRSAIIGRPPSRIDDPATAEGIEATARRCLATGKSVAWQVERRGRDGPPVFVEVIAAPLEYSNEEEGLVLFCGRDVTDQRAVEDALRQSQKMEAVGQLTGGLAHDFNNLLTGITGSLDLLQLRLSQGRYGQVERYVTGARDAATRAAALTHRLLAFSRRQTLDPKPTDLAAMVAGMSDLLDRAVGPEIAIRTKASPDLWAVLVDTSQLENTLLNLCINARDAMPEGGTILIEVENVRFDQRRADERDLAPGDYVSLGVSDNGVGMTPDVVARIFDPFFTTKPLGSGTGLGLSMIYGFARQSGGQVRAHSTPGLGTTMRVILPRHFGMVESPVRKTVSIEVPKARNGETVLVVDDEATVRMLLSEVLADRGYGVIEAVDGVTGVALLQSDARIDLLVTDIGLPGGVNGRQVAEAGRRSRPDLKVLFVTGYAENAVLNHGHLDAGMQVLTKPFDIDVFARRVEAFFDET